MRIKALTVVVCIISALYGGDLDAQESNHVISWEKDRIISGLLHTNLIGDIQCGDNGEAVFFRQAVQGDPSRAPIIRIDVRNGEYSTIHLSRLSSQHISAREFVASGSDLYVFGKDGKSSFIWKVDPGGELKQKIKLDRTFDDAIRLVPFESGSFLIIGSRYTREEELQTPIEIKSVVELYDASGQFLKTVALKFPQNAQAEIPKTYGNTAPVQKTSDTMPTAKNSLRSRKPLPEDSLQDQLERRTSLSVAVIARYQDKAYLIPHSNPTRLLVISASGEVEPEIILKKPEGSNWATNMRVLGQQALIEYRMPPDTKTGNMEPVFVLYDLTNGDAIATYKLAPGFLGFFACYDWRQQFTFLFDKDNMVSIRYGMSN
ncbi:MAG: hypothetical protein JST79_18775 [Acidobacteria bacterium]|nr:hypothetical protein [Acidobacteriota bacterium]